MAEDLDRIVALLGQLFAIETDFDVDAAKQRRGLELMLSLGDRCCVLVAQAGDQVVGMCTAQVLVSTAEGAFKILIEDVVVAREHRGQGIGAELMRAIEEWARGQGATRADLLADRRNERAVAFYERDAWRRTSLIGLQKRL
jgi:GNAT superfamily N-acetyltransferase